MCGEEYNTQQRKKVSKFASLPENLYLIVVRSCKGRRGKAVYVFHAQTKRLESTSQMTTSSVSGVRNNWNIRGGGGAIWRKMIQVIFGRSIKTINTCVDYAVIGSRQRERRNTTSPNFGYSKIVNIEKTETKEVRCSR